MLMGWFGYISLVGKRSKLFSWLNRKMSLVIKPNTTVGIIKVLRDNREKDLIRKQPLDLMELVQFSVSSRD